MFTDYTGAVTYNNAWNVNVHECCQKYLKEVCEVAKNLQKGSEWAIQNQFVDFLLPLHTYFRYFTTYRYMGYIQNHMLTKLNNC